MTSQRQATYLHVFDTSAAPVTSVTRLYKSRKSHVKSRQGCTSCKVRRVKCDEKKPSCSACCRRNAPCKYPSDPNVPRFLWPGLKSPIVLNNGESTFSTDHDLEMLHYFETEVGKIIWVPKYLPGVNEGVRELALKNQHVMHALIASAASYISATTSCKAYNSIQTRHWIGATSSFRKAIMNQNWNYNADALLTTCMLLNLLSFTDANADTIPTLERWPVVSHPSTPIHNKYPEPFSRPLSWLNIQLGLSPLLSSLSRHAMVTSIWLPLFLASQPESTYVKASPECSLPEPPEQISLPSSDTNPFHDDRTGTIGIPPAYISLFNITSTCEGETHPYLRPVRRIVSLLSLPPGNGSAMLYVQFIQGITPQYMRLLEARDPRALLLYALWMGLLCSVDFWWCRGRAKAECRAAVAYLHGDGDGMWIGSRGEDGEEEDEERRMILEIRNNGWLEMPARACGWVLRERGLGQE